MPRRVEHGEDVPADRHLVPIRQRARRRRRRDGKPHPRAQIELRVDQPLPLLVVYENRQLGESPAHLANARDVIGMRVRENQQFRREPMLLHVADHLAGVESRVDDQATGIARHANDMAVRLEGAEGEGLDQKRAGRTVTPGCRVVTHGVV